MDAAALLSLSLSLFFLVLSKLANKRQTDYRLAAAGHSQSVSQGPSVELKTGGLRAERKPSRSRADSSSNSVPNQSTGGGAG